MSIVRLNHSVIYIRELQRSLDFYTGLLGFRVVEQIGDRAAFLRASGSTNDHDLGLFAIGADAADSGAGRTSVGLYHLAWEVDTLTELQRIGDALQEGGYLTGASDHGATKALYARDPDGLEFELSWLVPAELLHLEPGGMKTEVLDLKATIKKYGQDTPGGVGVSR